MSASSSSDGIGFSTCLRVICLGCDHVSNSVEEHKVHQATAGHLDKGEAYK